MVYLEKTTQPQSVVLPICTGGDYTLKLYSSEGRDELPITYTRTKAGIYYNTFSIQLPEGADGEVVFELTNDAGSFYYLGMIERPRHGEEGAFESSLKYTSYNG